MQDAKSEYLADGITEGVITSLAQLTNLRVISRNSVFRYKGREVDAQSIGRKLKVQALLLGRVVRSDDLLSISVELIDTEDDRHLWGAQYIRNPSDLFATYETIARALREKLQLEAPACRATTSIAHRKSSSLRFVSKRSLLLQ